MIVWFRFQNYGSFWHNTLISMQSGIYREHPEHLVPGPKGSLLKTLAIYGPNSSGKSQLINALAFYAAFVRRQLPFSPDSLWNLPGSGSLSGLSYSCCQNRNAAGSSPLSMSMCFFFHGHTFEYGFTLKVLPPDRRHVFRDAKCAARLLRDGWCVGRRRMMVYSGRRCTDGGIPDRQPNPSFPKRSKAPPPGKSSAAVV